MKKFLSLLLVTVMLLGGLCSCASPKNPEDPENVDDTTEDTASGYVEKTVVKTEEFDVKEGLSVKLEFMGADGYLSKINVFMGEEKKDSLDLREASKVAFGQEEGAYSDDGEFAFAVEDMNFDGYSDFLIEGWNAGEGNTPYFCYLWNNSKGNFEYAFHVVSPTVNKTAQKIYSTVMEDGKEYVYMYRVFEGALLDDGHFSLSDSVEFTVDLSEYEQYMNPADRDGYLMLLNKTHSVDENYVPENMIDVVNTRKDGRATQKMVETAEKALEALYLEMYAAGYTDVSVTSAYRSYEYQGTLYNNYVNSEMSKGLSREDAEKEANKYSALPGTSEHQAALCCDMHNLPSASQAFENQKAYKWLCDNAWKFGFILRYPKDKEDVTGYIFEPWHYRFVGRYHAEKIHNFGLCFEEYLELIK